MGETLPGSRRSSESGDRTHARLHPRPAGRRDHSGRHAPGRRETRSATALSLRLANSPDRVDAGAAAAARRGLRADHTLARRHRQRGQHHLRPDDRAVSGEPACERLQSGADLCTGADRDGCCGTATRRRRQRGGRERRARRQGWPRSWAGQAGDVRASRLLAGPGRVAAGRRSAAGIYGEPDGVPDLGAPAERGRDRHRTGTTDLRSVVRVVPQVRRRRDGVRPRSRRDTSSPGSIWPKPCSIRTGRSTTATT